MKKLSNLDPVSFSIAENTLKNTTGEGNIPANGFNVLDKANKFLYNFVTKVSLVTEPVIYMVSSLMNNEYNANGFIYTFWILLFYLNQELFLEQYH